MSQAGLTRFIDSERKLLRLIFIFFTLISGVQYLQYFIAYNSSYPFPWKYNLGITFGTFYTYFLLVPVFFKLSQKLRKRLTTNWQLVLAHLFLGLVVSFIHLLLVQVLEWAQVYRFSEATFSQSYRWKLARWLHLEMLLYTVLVTARYGVGSLSWKKAAAGVSIAEVQKETQFLSTVKVKTGSETRYVAIDQVRWIEAYDNYIKCFMNEGFVVVRSTLSGIEKGLDPEGFQRIHRSCIVALREVDLIRGNGSNYEVILKDGNTLKLSRTYKSALEEKMSASVQD
ncbi:MAG: LytTR family transcriptional regulator [Roseivirga sp.]|nr:LytTR family transcriptional regulator [Roseivirga sp.]